MSLKTAEKQHLTGEFKLKSEFQSGNYAREEILTRVERYAGWTLPSVFPNDPLMEYDEMQNDFQSVGAQAVTNLSNKMMMALFQPSKPFFRMQLTQQQKEDLETENMSSAQVDATLAQTERDAMVELNRINARVVLNDAIQHLIITGNALLHLPRNDKMQLYSVRDYTIQRDLKGNVVKLIMRETKAAVALPDDLQAIAYSAGYSESDELTMYTCVRRVDTDKFLIWQELEDICYCHKAVGYVKEDDLEYIPLVWKLCRGKDYGTGLVEDYAGDFHSLSTLAEAILDFTTVCTDVKNLVNPTGMTDVRELTQTPSGGYVHGREQDIYSYTAAKELGNSAAFLENQFDKKERRLAAAFLLNTSVTRDAERVTAEEIRMQAHELESSLGGVYSRLATELQLPLAKRLIAKLDEAFKAVEPIIVTGFESLSRNSDLDNMRAFIGDLSMLTDVPEEVKARLKIGDLIAVLGAGHGVEYDKVLKDEETVKRDRQQSIKDNATVAGTEAQAVAQAQEQTQ